MHRFVPGEGFFRLGRWHGFHRAWECRQEGKALVIERGGFHAWKNNKESAAANISLEGVDGLAGEGEGVAENNAGVVLEWLLGEGIGGDAYNGLRAAEAGFQGRLDEECVGLFANDEAGHEFFDIENEVQSVVLGQIVLGGFDPGGVEALIQRRDAELGGFRSGGGSFYGAASGLFSIHSENRCGFTVRAGARKGRRDFSLDPLAEPGGLDRDRGRGGIVGSLNAKDRYEDDEFLEVGERGFSGTVRVCGHRLPRHGLVVREDVNFHLAVLVGFFECLGGFLQRGAHLRGGRSEGEIFYSGEDFLFV